VSFLFSWRFRRKAVRQLAAARPGAILIAQNG
jgi:hypothetical protein